MALTWGHAAGYKLSKGGVLKEIQLGQNYHEIARYPNLLPDVLLLLVLVTNLFVKPDLFIS